MHKSQSRTIKVSANTGSRLCAQGARTVWCAPRATPRKTVRVLQLQPCPHACRQGCAYVGCGTACTMVRHAHCARFARVYDAVPAPAAAVARTGIARRKWIGKLHEARTITTESDCSELPEVEAPSDGFVYTMDGDDETMDDEQRSADSAEGFKFVSDPTPAANDDDDDDTRQEGVEQEERRIDPADGEPYTMVRRVL